MAIFYKNIESLGSPPNSEIPKDSTSYKLDQLQAELRKNPKDPENIRIRSEIANLKRELNRSKQFTAIKENEILKGKESLDTVSASNLMRIDKETGLRRGEFLSKSFLYKRTTDVEGNIYEEPSDGKDLKEGDSLFVDFGKNRSAESKVGAGDFLSTEIRVIKVTDSNGKVRIGKRSIQGKKVGYYDEQGYIPVYNGSTIEIPAQKEAEKHLKEATPNIALSTDTSKEDIIKDAFIAVAERYEKAGPTYAPGLRLGQREYTERAKELSEDIEKRYGIPRQVVFAQAAIESGWGTSSKSKGQNNFFGITAGGREKGFRTFGSMQESFEEYGKLLSQNERYSQAFSHKDNPILFIETILKSGYIDTSVDNYEGYMRTASEIIGKYDNYSTTYLDYNTRSSDTNTLFGELGGTREAIESQLISTDFLGAKITVHKSILGALGSAANEIKGDSVASQYKIYNAGGYNWRQKRGGSTLSNHALGIAIDLNSSDNMGDFGDGSSNIPPAFVNIMKKYGFIWGGDWKSPRDPMHFEFSNLQNLKVARANSNVQQA